MDLKCCNVALFRKREVYLPTVWGWLPIAAGIALLLAVFLFKSHSFLAYTHPVEAQILIVEGWMPDYGLEAAISEFDAGAYRYILAIGGPLPKGYHRWGYRTGADLAVASLTQMGMARDKVIALPSPYVPRDRTFAAALEVRRWLAENLDLRIEGANLVSLGTHARRSHYMVREALPQDVRLGVIAIQQEDYDSDRWWLSSAGVRAVLFEGIACVYALLFGISTAVE